MTIIKSALNFIKPINRELVKSRLLKLNIKVKFIPQPEDKLNYFKALYEFNILTDNYKAVRVGIKELTNQRIALSNSVRN